MALKNVTKNIYLVDKSHYLKHTFQKTLGLMFSNELDDEAMVFVFREEQKVPLHMFFVFHSIDVLFINKNFEVVELKERLKPFRMLFPREKAKYVIELPRGIIRKTMTSIGDKMMFV